MKKIILCIFVILSIFTFNLNVMAEELDTKSIDLIDGDLSNDSDLDNINDELINNEYKELISDNEILVQHTKVNVSKVNNKGELIVGAKLQILDLEGNVLYEWVSDGTVHEVVLSAGKYILHEVEAPEGYILAEDKEFEVEVVIDEEIIGDAEMSEIPCDHGEDNSSPMYYIEINGVSYEVYCINQGLATPNGIGYNGQILTPEEIRNFTLQETNIDGEGFTISGNRINVNTEVIPDFDVSDQTLTNQELYDKVLDIIYHRYLAEKDERFSQLTTAEIRFITEIALKNYLNARITTYETVRVLDGAKTVHVSYNENGEKWQDGDGKKYIKLYNKFYNREYIYDEESPTGYVISSGNGDSIGNFAKHWYGSHGKTKMPKIYADLFYFLISNDIEHPESMQVYLYSPTVFLSDNPYQNLLGITGFIDDIDTKEQFVEIKNDYNIEKRDISVVKVWENDNYDVSERPKSIRINLYADGELYKTIKLSKDNNWSYVFKNLDVYKDGKKIIYTVSEVLVPFYKSEITGNMETGFKVVNTHYEQGDIELLENQIINPYTGDNIYINMLFAIFSSFGIFGLLLCIRLD